MGKYNLKYNWVENFYQGYVCYQIFMSRVSKKNFSLFVFLNILNIVTSVIHDTLDSLKTMIHNYENSICLEKIRNVIGGSNSL